MRDAFAGVEAGFVKRGSGRGTRQLEIESVVVNVAMNEQVALRRERDTAATIRECRRFLPASFSAMQPCQLEQVFSASRVEPPRFYQRRCRGVQVAESREKSADLEG